MMNLLAWRKFIYILFSEKIIDYVEKLFIVSDLAFRKTLGFSSKIIGS